MIKLYDFPQSPNCQKVKLVLAEKDLSYETVFVDLMNNAQRSADFLRLNPYGKVPVLIDEDEVIYDSTIINEYLDDEYPHPPLMPTGSDERARARLFEDFADNSFMPQANVLATELSKAADQIDQERIQRYRSDLVRVLEFLDRHLEGKEYLVQDFAGRCRVCPASAGLGAPGSDRAREPDECHGLDRAPRATPVCPKTPARTDRIVGDRPAA